MEQASKGASTVKSALLILGTAVIISTMLCVQADIWMDQWRNLIRPLTRSIGDERSLTAGRVKKLIPHTCIDALNTNKFVGVGVIRQLVTFEIICIMALEYEDRLL